MASLRTKKHAEKDEKSDTRIKSSPHASPSQLPCFTSHTDTTMMMTRHGADNIHSGRSQEEANHKMKMATKAKTTTTTTMNSNNNNDRRMASSAGTSSTTTTNNPSDPSSSSSSSSSRNRIQSWMKDMDWKSKIGQMSQIEINLLLTTDKSQLDQSKVEFYIGELGIGSVLNNIVNNNDYEHIQNWSITDFRRASIQLQDTARNYNRPPVIWGLDSVHGANYLVGTITTPQPLNIASSFNTTLSYQAGRWASYDTRSAGIQWLFSPLLGLAWEPSWSRMYETFGEDPFLVGIMASNMVQGIQQYDDNNNNNNGDDDSNHPTTTTTSAATTVTTPLVPSRAAACAKHWIGYSMPHNGHDRAPSWIPTRHLYQYFVPPWEKVFEDTTKTTTTTTTTTNTNTFLPVLTVMESYTEIDGIPNVANRHTLEYLLRRRLGFQGVVVTDYHEIFNLAEFHKVAKNTTTAVVHALQEGSVDMSMIPWNADEYREAIESHLVVATPEVDEIETKQQQQQQQQDDEVIMTEEEKKKKTKRDGSWISKERINTSVERVLQLKLDLNMMDENITMTNGGGGGDNESGGLNKPSTQSIADALDMTHQTIILAKNAQHTLPIPTFKRTTPLKVLVTGPTGNSLSYQTGGWTGQWQGVDPSKEQFWFTYGSTVYGAALEHPGWDVSFDCGVGITGGGCDDNNDGDGNNPSSSSSSASSSSSVLDKVKSWVGWGDEDQDVTAYYSIERTITAASDMDYVIICVGEESYTEKPGDIRSLRLPQGQYELVEGLKQTTNAKLILIYLGGRPRLLETMVDNVDAVLLGFLPGPLAGDAILDILTGQVNPSAKLPITYPKYEDGGGIPYLHAISDMCTKGDTSEPLPHFENSPCEVQWPFGHGLSYTTFEYSDLEVSSTILKSLRSSSSGTRHEDDLVVSVSVQNSGPFAGSETVLFFTFDDFRSVTPEYKRLRGFDKIWLEPGASQRVNVTIPMKDLRFVGPHDETHYILQNGLSFRVGVGANTDCRKVTGDNSHSACSPVVTIQTEDDYVGACEAACDLWAGSGCSDYFDMTAEMCWGLCTSIHDDYSLQMNNDGWGWNYVSCLEDVVWGNSFHKDPSHCWKTTSFCRDVFITAHMDQFGHGDAMLDSGSGLHDTMSLVLGLLSGVVASIMIYYGVRGGFARREEETYGDVQFSAVPGGHDLT